MVYSSNSYLLPYMPHQILWVYPIFLIVLLLSLPEGGSKSSPGNGPPHNEPSHISGANSSDLLTRKCYNQIPVRYHIWDPRHTPNCRLDTVEL